MAYFSGKKDCRVDDRGRLRLPSDILSQLIGAEKEEAEVYIRLGLDHCLYLEAEEVWDKQAERFKQMDEFDEEARQLKRWFFASSQKVSLDRNGRILPPAEFANAVGIERDVKIVGNFDRFELWNPDKYEESEMPGNRLSRTLSKFSGKKKAN